MKYLILLLSLIMLISCAAIERPPLEVVIKHAIVKSPDGSEEKIEIAEEATSKSMAIENPYGQLLITFINQNRAFAKIYSAISVSDVMRFWNDITWLEYNTSIRTVELFINSPGGDAFSGLALADQIEGAIKKGFTINAHASGIIASAAVPVFAVCSTRNAASGTIFMVHEAAIWKWPGRESASDIRSQNNLMELLRDRYIGKLVAHSDLTLAEWHAMESETSWFSAQKAMEYGIVDNIE